MSEKSELYKQQAEQCLEYNYPENPELQQSWSLKGIGYTLLAIFELFQEIRNENNNK